MKKNKKIFEKNDLIKISLIVVAITLLLTWLIPYNYYRNGVYQGYTYGRHGLVDISLANYYSLSFFLQQIFMVLSIGVFYGIISKTQGYQGLITKIAHKFRNKTKLFVIISSLFVTLFTSISTQTFVVIVFLPFIISIAKKLNLDKITTFAITFGSLIVGILGATYGTEGLNYFVYYLSNYSDYVAVNIAMEVGIRFGVLALAFIIFNTFTILHMKKIEKNNKELEITPDLFESEVSGNKKVKTWPMALVFYILLIVSILGYVNWSENFGVTIFEDFHEWLTELSIGNYTIFQYILGANARAFGSWELYAITVVMGILLLIVSLSSHTKFDEIIDNAIEGIKKVIKPLIIFSLINVVFAIIYTSPFTTSITKWLVELTENFNPFIMTLSAAINSLFHLDFGYTGYVVGELLTSTYAAQFNVLYVIYSTITGLMGLIAPTGVILMLGLAFLDIPYKKWIKHIWKFFLIMLVLLLILFSLMTYL